MATFRILHVSDLHLARVSEAINVIDIPTSRESRRQAADKPIAHRSRVTFRYPTTYDPAALQDVAEYVYYDSNLDLIIVSGDLATTGDYDDLTVALRFVTAPAETGWFSRRDEPTLAATQVPIAILPGNHDRYVVPTFPFGTGGILFDEMFNDYWSVGQNACVLGVLEGEGERLGIIAADFSLRPEHPADLLGHAGQGEVYRHVLKSLRQHTRRVRAHVRQRYDEEIAIIWVVHFAPEFSSLSGLLRLRSESTLVAAAEEERVSHILCGHTHEHREYVAPTRPTVAILCAGAGSAYKSHNGNQMHVREVDVVAGKIQPPVRSRTVILGNR